MLLSFHVNCKPGLEFHDEFILKDCYPGDEPFYQIFIKHGDPGGLATDEILQVSNLLHSLIPRGCVNSGLLL